LADDATSATLLPLGDAALLVRFADSLSDAANRAAIAFAARLEADPPEGIEEIAPGLVSVLLRVRPGADLWRLSGELRLRMGAVDEAPLGREHSIAITFDGEDVPEVASLTGLSPDAFVEHHNAAPLRVLATGFAPGFVYCGFHDRALVVPRREQVRPMVAAGTVLFAAGQTAIAATPIRTGWHIIGRTSFQNFDAKTDPPTLLAAGDTVRFVVAA
jgi:KipI family sensor histidine kinase inhibitor